MKLIKGIIENPDDDEKRIFKWTNKTILAKVINLWPIEANNVLIRTLGYERIDEE